MFIFDRIKNLKIKNGGKNMGCIETVLMAWAGVQYLIPVMARLTSYVIGIQI